MVEAVIGVGRPGRPVPGPRAGKEAREERETPSPGGGGFFFFFFTSRSHDREARGRTRTRRRRARPPLLPADQPGSEFQRTVSYGAVHALHAVPPPPGAGGPPLGGGRVGGAAVALDQHLGQEGLLLLLMGVMGACKRESGGEKDVG